MKVITIDSDDLVVESNRLFDKVIGSGFYPTHMVAIARRGVDVADQITPDRGTGIKRVIVRAVRPGSPRRSKRLVTSRVLRRMPYWITDPLRWVGTLWLIAYRHPADPNSLPPLDPESSEALMKIDAEKSTCVLVIDDAVDSGVTLARVLRSLRHVVEGGGEVRSAVINVTGRNPVVRPDYCIFEGACCRFLWSDDFRS